MNDKPTYEVLEKQIAELKKQNEILRLNFSLQNEENKKQEAELNIAIEKAEESETKWRTLFEILPVGVSIRDKENNILECNPALLTILDLTKTDLENRKYQQRTYLNSDNRQIKPEEFPSNRSINEQKIIQNFEIGIVKENGTTIWTKVSASPFINHTNCVIVTTDITKQKQQVKILKESEERAKTLLDNLPCIALIIQKETRQIIAFNSKAREFGAEIGKKCYQLWKNNNQICEFCLANEVFNSQKAKEIEVSQNDKYYQCIWVPLSNNQFVHYIFDISVSKQSELKIQQQTNELIKLNADKDRFISILAHDLRNPFSSILGFLNLLSKNIRKYDIEKIEQQINIVNYSAQNTFNLLEDILLWVRSQSGKLPYEPQKISFTKNCIEVIDGLKQCATEKNITINHFTPLEVNILADVNMFKTILRNLITNAIKFTNNDGQINIYAERNEEIVITITVSDNGIGIEPEKINQLFDISQIFTTTGTAQEKGTGLGLLLCKEFVEKHGGKIWVESIFNKGSDFKFTMPLCND
jgi:PAS domain S-box-containing protein